MENLLREFIVKEKNGVCTYQYDILLRRGRQFTITVKNVNSFGDKKSKEEIRALVIRPFVQHLIKDGSGYADLIPVPLTAGMVLLPFPKDWDIIEKRMIKENRRIVKGLLRI